MSPGQNVTQEVRAKRHPVGQGKTSQGNMSQGNMSPRAKRLRAECHIVVLNCQQCNQCFKCQVSGHKIFKKSENFPNI